MEALRRIKKVINWLIFKEIASNERELAEVMGYTKSSFSQIVTGKVPIADKFLNKLCSLCRMFLTLSFIIDFQCFSCFR